MTLTDWIDEAAEKYAQAKKGNAGIVRYNGFLAGALAAVEKLSAMGVGEFDNKHATHMANDFYPGKENHNARYIFIDGAMNQHSQTAALLAARNLEMARLKSELSKLEEYKRKYEGLCK